MRNIENKITIFSHDLSHNCLGRAHALAKMLQTRWDVDIVGPLLYGSDIWAPVRDDASISYRVIEDVKNERQVARAADGQILYSVKARETSLGLALQAQRTRARPLVADVDDWELGFYLSQPKGILRDFFKVSNPDAFLRTWRAEGQVRHADAVTVSSTWLRTKFGGTIIPHARDGSAFQFSEQGRMRVRESLGVEDSIVVMFSGTARIHKGLGDLIQAMDLVTRNLNAKLVIAGKVIGMPSRDYLRTLDMFPFAEIPDVLSAADIVVIPQKESLSTRAQVPAKIFDAMAMGRAIVATDVSDLKCIIGGGGLVVTPGSTEGLAGAIGSLVTNEEDRQRMGSASRSIFEEHFSYDAVAPRLVDIFEALPSG